MTTEIVTACTPAAESQATNCIFEEPWWMDAVAPGCWSAAEVTAGGQVQARLTYAVGKTLGLRTIRQPPLTQTLGPWYRPTGAKTSGRLAREKDLAEELIAKLPPHDFMSVNFHRSVTNWLPFFWKGFTASPRITYVIDDLGNTARLWSNLQENIRREVRKAQKRIEIVRSDDIDRFLELNRKTFARQGRSLPYAPAVVARLDSACANRAARSIYLAVDEQGRTHGATYTVHDARCTYYLMGGGDPVLRNSGAGSLLLWTAIQDAASRSATFDFEGSMGVDIERFFRGFGAEQATYLNLRWTGRIAGALEGLRAALRSLKGS